MPARVAQAAALPPVKADTPRFGVGAPAVEPGRRGEQHEISAGVGGRVPCPVDAGFGADDDSGATTADVDDNVVGTRRVTVFVVTEVTLALHADEPPVACDRLGDEKSRFPIVRSIRTRPSFRRSS